jgi:hypothetical protein
VSNATAWLIGQQNPSDGSWGVRDDLRYVSTAEGALALLSAGQVAAPYYASIAWLDNHAPQNIDFAARRMLTIGKAGATVVSERSLLQASQNLTAPGNSGWGLSAFYQGSPLDTALALQALSQQGVTTGVSQGVSYLLSVQLPASSNDAGWALGQEAVSDPTTTAHVVLALIPQKSANTSVPAAITNGLAALNAKVGASSPAHLVALAALAHLKDDPSSVVGTTLANALLSQQAANGSWGGNDPYATALAIRALSPLMSASVPSQMSAAKTVDMPDNNLRAAINRMLGRGAMDAIRASDLLSLNSLDLSGTTVRDLTGLQFATNLTHLNLGRNKFGSLLPIAGLSRATILGGASDGAPTSSPAGLPVPIDAEGMRYIIEMLMGDS